jgi:hypothetical protein
MRRVLFFDLKATTAVLLVSCFAAGALCAVSDPSAAKDEKAAAVLVDRTLKGDRLPQNVVRTGGPAALSPTGSLTRKVPLGCDRAFSPAVDPAYAHVFGRCAA